MRYDEFKKCLKVAGLSVKELAELLDMQPNSITNYRARGSVPRHLEVIARLLEALTACGGRPAEVFGTTSRPRND